MTDSICLRCNHKRYCGTGVVQPSENSHVTGCSRFEPKPPQTNADKIRAMTDEELAEWLGDMHETTTCPNHGNYNCSPSCRRCWLDWLQKEADE